MRYKMALFRVFFQSKIEGSFISVRVSEAYKTGHNSRFFELSLDW